MIIGFFTCSLSTILVFVFDNNGYMFIIFIGLSKFLCNFVISFIYNFTTEIYPTQIRNTGLGVAGSIGYL